MGNYFRNCTQSWCRVSKVAYRHVSVSQKSKCTETYKLHTGTSSYVKICIRTRSCNSKNLCWGTSFYSWQVAHSIALVESVYSDTVFYVKSCILRRFRKLKSRGCTPFQVGQGWNTWRDMLNVTHRHVFVSQQVCRHQSFSMWTRAWARLVDDSFCVETCWSR